MNALIEQITGKPIDEDFPGEEGSELAIAKNILSVARFVQRVSSDLVVSKHAGKIQELAQQLIRMHSA